MKTHWLHGLVVLQKEIEAETDCLKCIHVKVCARDMEKRCENFNFGTSEFRGCGMCTHKYTRFDTDSRKVPCFSCPDFREEIDHD